MVSNRTLRTAARALMLAAAVAVPVTMMSSTSARAEVVISVAFGPPALPVYAQPICPGDGFLWTPGYWAYGPDGYFWVPGTWVRPPQVGFLWTPGYWGWGGSAFIYHAGYWGSHVGFYGGINYGFGYGGVGYEGGYWRGNSFLYNRSVNHIDVNIHNVYERPVTVRNAEFNHVSFNGGNGGIPYRASAQEMQAEHERHVQPTGEQMQHQTFASQNRAQFASVNHGRPGVAAAPTPSAFHSNPGNPAAARGGFGNTVNQREGNQQQRIANGVRSGEMTSGEAGRADQRQANIDRQVHNDRTANGGALTGQERQQVNREQNGASNQINRENHNANTAPHAEAPAQPRQEPRPAAAPRQESRPAPTAHPAPAAHENGGGHEKPR